MDSHYTVSVDGHLVNFAQGLRLSIPELPNPMARKSNCCELRDVAHLGMQGIHCFFTFILPFILHPTYLGLE